MTPEEQHTAATRMLDTMSHEHEFRLRGMAEEAAAARHTRFPIRVPTRFDPSASASAVQEVEVRLAVPIGNLHIRMLLAERILRPQLRELGWDV